ncbi:MAG: MarR family transcriptional regulator [Anaerolineales bacterium]|nr:MarR family transcriptional regulator [Anaerolineales bacterium]MCB8968444.1 MarR family transcriptional regulator [Ardenticatenaceae bacterium]
MIPTDLEITAQQILLILPMLMRIMAAEFRQMQRALLPAHLSVMFILSQGSCNLSELAEQLAVSPPTMSNTVSKLVADGLVARTRSEQDRRIVQITLTATGQTLLHEIVTSMVARVTELLTSLSTAELQTIDQGLAALQHAFTGISKFVSLPQFDKSCYVTQE